MLESGARIRSANLDKWLSEPMTARFEKYRLSQRF